MKRYRVLNADFDTRSDILKIKIQNNWDQHVKDSWIRNQNIIYNDLLKEFGEKDFDIKIKNFLDIETKPFSILAFHNNFFHQIRYSYIIGSYYPALTATCSLGERILNHLILKLRDYYKKSPDYKKIYRKDSFDNWDEALNFLYNNKIILKTVKEYFEKLKNIRNKNIHFDYSTDKNDRVYSLDAIKLMNKIIKDQFNATGDQIWFIENTKGVTYIKKEYENNPFIKEIYLPNCFYVGPKHKVIYKNGFFDIIDDNIYENKEISDKEFINIAKQYNMA